MVPQAISAQAVTAGTRVRVTHPGEGTRTGTVVGLTADTLEVRLAGHSEASHLPLAQVTRLDVSLGTQRRLARFAGIGRGSRRRLSICFIYVSHVDLFRNLRYSEASFAI